MEEIGHEGLKYEDCLDYIAQMQVLGHQIRGERLAIIREPADAKIGSIYIPDQAQEKPLRGTVISVGPLVNDISPGDRVIFTKYRNIRVGFPLMDGRMLSVELLHEADVYVNIAKDRQ